MASRNTDIIRLCKVDGCMNLGEAHTKYKKKSGEVVIYRRPKCSKHQKKSGGDSHICVNPQIPWMAGFFDGEGSVMIVNGGEARFGRLVASIPNTEKEPLDIFHKRYFGNLYLDPKRDDPNRKPVWRYALQGMNAVRLLKDIHMYCVIKKERIGIALEYASLLNKILYKRDLNKIDISLIDRINFLIFKLKSLNKRGKPTENQG